MLTVHVSATLFTFSNGMESCSLRIVLTISHVTELRITHHLKATIPEIRLSKFNLTAFNIGSLGSKVFVLNQLKAGFSVFCVNY